MHPVRVTTYDLTPSREPLHTDAEGPFGKLVYAEVSGGRLAYDLELGEGEHPLLTRIQGHVLPAHGLKVVRFTRRRPERDDYDYYVDIVRVTEQGERWVVRDLYLDVLVFDGVRAKVLDTDEYLAAAAEGHMDEREAEYALLKLHDFIDGLARHGYTLSRYLASQGVTLTWRT